MANANMPLGLGPIESNGKPWSGQGVMGLIPASVGANVGRNQLIVPLGGSDAFGVPLMGPAGIGDAMPGLGVMLSIINGPAGASAPVLADAPLYAASGVDQYILMTQDPEQLYVAQEDSVGGAIAQANAAFKTINLIAGAVNTATGFTTQQLDSSSVGTTATSQLKLLGILKAPDNALGNYCKFVVRINLNALTRGAGF